VNATPVFRLAFLALLSIGVSCSPVKTGDGDDRSRLLVDPARLGDGEFPHSPILLDAREKKKFEESRIPRARWVDAAAWAKAFGDGKDATARGRPLGDLGIPADSTVIVYDDVKSKDAARVWWILRYWGLRDVRLLDGGWLAYTAAKLPIEAEVPRPPEPTSVVVVPGTERLATKESVLAALQTSGTQIIDARSEKEYCGVEKQAKRGGAIPGARNLEWTELIDPSTQRFKSSLEIRRLLEDAGVDTKRPALAHCQSGGRSSVMVFALELIGMEGTRNYYASWAEWGNAEDTPIGPGKPKAKAEPASGSVPPASSVPPAPPVPSEGKS